MTLDSSNAPELLALIRDMGSQGIAESELDSQFLLRFLPLAEHARALDPAVLLVIGDRGAGKTELFGAIQSTDGLKAISAFRAGRALPDISKTKWLVGYATRGTEYPPEGVFRKFAQGRDSNALQNAWLGLMLRCLVRHGVLENNGDPISRQCATGSLRLEALHSCVETELESAFERLDQLDETLRREDRWVFLSYDELDRVSAGDWEVMKTILRGLVQFWASYVRRWERIRPKVFLRRDLFERVALFGPDVSKIAAQRVELNWSNKNLYTLVAKRLLNQGELLKQYLESTDLRIEDAGALGWFPQNPDEAALNRIVQTMCGQYMGAGPNKGTTVKWIPNHLQDGNGRVLPRSIVRLFEGAAEIEDDNRRAHWPCLLHHSSLRGAVDKVSTSRVLEIEGEEFPWIKTVRTTLEGAKKAVPIERRELERVLTIDWSDVDEKPPERTGRDLLKLLMELGIFYLRTDGRVDVRDLYLKGFGFKRKGGVAQPH